MGKRIIIRGQAAKGEENRKLKEQVKEKTVRKLPKAGTIEIAPSVLSADFARLAEEVADVQAAGVKMIHLDVMDGHFVPNITIGPVVIEKLRKHTDLVFDAHLMITDPDKYIEQFVKAGVNHVTFHIEATRSPRQLIEKLHRLGVTAGVTLNPETPVEAIEAVASLCDMVLVMTVHPGFPAQSFIPEAATKCVRLRQLLGPGVRVEVDGGIDAANAALVVSYGADTLVVGHAIFSAADRAAAISAIRAAVK
jgi:ribulose-phosphate 3-epimerase